MLVQGTHAVEVAHATHATHAVVHALVHHGAHAISGLEGAHAHALNLNPLPVGPDTCTS